MGSNEEDPTAIECSVDLDDGIEYDVGSHEDTMAAEMAVEANEPKDVEQQVVKKEEEAEAAPAKTLEDDNDDERKCNPINKKCLILCAILIILILAIVLPIVLTSGAEESAPTLAPTSLLTSDLVDILRPYTPVETLLNPDTPQGQALMELTAEVEASGETPTDHRVKQRYALMVLYLATTPGGWSTSFGWKGFDADECSWYGISTCRLLDYGSYAVTNIALRKFLIVGHGSIMDCT
jgi:hypothetical protein